MHEKKVIESTTNISYIDLDGKSFRDMAFFEKLIPLGCKLLKVEFYHEYGYYDEPGSFGVYVTYSYDVYVNKYQVFNTETNGVLPERFKTKAEATAYMKEIETKYEGIFKVVKNG